MCACQIKPKTQNTYSIHSSLVEHEVSIRGGGASVQAEAESIYLKLGLAPSQDENEGLYLVPSDKFSGAFRISGALEK
jgi:hypothetical protein